MSEIEKVIPDPCTVEDFICVEHIGTTHERRVRYAYMDRLPALNWSLKRDFKIGDTVTQLQVHMPKQVFPLTRKWVNELFTRMEQAEYGLPIDYVLGTWIAEAYMYDGKLLNITYTLDVVLKAKT